jgi:hypothetical protein
MAQSQKAESRKQKAEVPLRIVRIARKNRRPTSAFCLLPSAFQGGGFYSLTALSREWRDNSIMNALASLFLLAALTIQTPTLVLRSGTRYDVDGSVRVEGARVLFRAAGALYSLPVDEVDLDATRAAAVVVIVKPETRGKLKVSDEKRKQLLRDLEQNHNGGPPANVPVALDVPRNTEADKTPAEKSSSEEWQWRRQARGYEDGVRRAKEDLAQLHDRADKLRSQIHAFVSRGYKPNQFTYQSTELENALAQIPSAELEVTRAERALAQFREDARKLGVMPGWLRD